MKARGVQFDFAEHLLTAAFTQSAGDGVFFLVRDAFGKSSFFALPGGLAEFREEGLETRDEAVERNNGFGPLPGVGGTLRKKSQPATVIPEPGLPFGMVEGSILGGKPKIETAATDSGKEIIRSGREEEDGGIMGWLLKRFEEGVGSRIIHAIRFVNERDFAISLVWRVLNIPYKTAGFADADMARFMGWAQGKEIRVA